MNTDNPDSPVPKFSLKSREDVEKFEKELKTYSEIRTAMQLPYSFLTDSFDCCQKRNDGGKLFSAILDIHINLPLVYCDIVDAGAIWNENFSKAKSNGLSILESSLNFQKKMDIHRSNSSFIFRYRAIWDKLMGLLVLLFHSEKYENFFRQKAGERALRINGTITRMSRPNSLKT